MFYSIMWGRFAVLLALCLCPFAVIASLVPGYVGCFYDNSARDLNGYWTSSSSMTPGNCEVICIGQGAYYFGVQDGNQCFCGTSYGSYGQAPDGDCNMACVGNPAQGGDAHDICGGSWRNSVYQVPGPHARLDRGSQLDTMNQDGTLTAKALYSGDGRFQLTVQVDGSLILYEVYQYTESILWTANSYQSNVPGRYILVMQRDENLVLYKIAGTDPYSGANLDTPIWASNTVLTGGEYALLQNDGNLVIYGSDGHPTWATGSCVQCH